jgi:hypothetical protein
MPKACARLGHFLADVAVAEEPDGPSEQPARFRELFLVPLAGAQFRDVVRNAAVEGEQQREREFGDGNRVLAGTVRHVDAARRSRGDVDGVVARTRAHHERQRTAFEHRRRDRSAAHHQDVRRGLANRGGERLVFQIRLVQDFAAGGLQTVDPRLFELVGD